MSRVNALDAFVTGVGSKVVAGSTAATSMTHGEVDLGSVLTGVALTMHSGVDLATQK